MSNPCGKTRPKDQPYEVWEQPNGWRFAVLKKYQSPEGEAKNPMTIWFTYVYGGDSFPELGDTYKADIVRYGRLIEKDGQPVTEQPERDREWLARHDATVNAMFG